MTAGAKHLEITLETQVESVNLAEEMCLRVAEAAGFGEDDCYRIGMSVREGVINAFHYGNQERPEKKRAFMDEFDVVTGRTGGAEIVMSKNLPVPGGNSTNGRGGEGTAPKQGA
ncbi:MAG: hypothetical protein DMG42_36290 [Acidobacteria bacterium]|nr:MAG: hypothetical protein DMG42_36290 [Acidobacteriota bacterium]